jgi:hypothetical protein
LRARKEVLEEIGREDLNIYIYHIKPQFEKDLIKELSEMNVTILKEGDIIPVKTLKE